MIAFGVLFPQFSDLNLIWKFYWSFVCCAVWQFNYLTVSRHLSDWSTKLWLFLAEFLKIALLVLPPPTTPSKYFLEKKIDMSLNVFTLQPRKISMWHDVKILFIFSFSSNWWVKGLGTFNLCKTNDVMKWIFNFICNKFVIFFIWKLIAFQFRKYLLTEIFCLF